MKLFITEQDTQKNTHTLYGKKDNPQFSKQNKKQKNTLKKTKQFQLVLPKEQDNTKEENQGENNYSFNLFFTSASPKQATASS